MSTRRCYFVYLLSWNAARRKLDKKPVGSPAAASMTFIEAHAEAMRYRAQGQSATVGMWIAGDSGLFFLDIDSLPGEFVADERAQQLTAMFPGAFCEWSSGKRGLHIVGRMTTPMLHCNRNDTHKLEFYVENRGIALNIDMQPTGSMDSTHDIAPLVAAYFPPRIAQAATSGVRPEWRGPADDAVLIERMLNARQSAASAFGGKLSLQQLWSGECEHNSEADMALRVHGGQAHNFASAVQFLACVGVAMQQDSSGHRLAELKPTTIQQPGQPMRVRTLTTPFVGAPVHMQRQRGRGFRQRLHAREHSANGFSSARVNVCTRCAQITASQCVPTGIGAANLTRATAQHVKNFHRTVSNQ